MAQATEGTQADRPLTEEMRSILDRAQRGDPTALPPLRAFLDEHPEVWQEVGDLHEHAVQSLLGLIASSNLLVRESITRQMDQLRKELEGEGASPSALERLLVQRVLVSWLHVHHADMDAVAAEAAGNGPRCAHAQRRLGQAHNRYLQSIKALATVRKLLKPALSPLALASRAVEETRGPANPRGRCGNPLRDGVPVPN